MWAARLSTTTTAPIPPTARGPRRNSTPPPRPRPGTYRLSGVLSQGQIFVDLGDTAKTDPEAVVTLILDGVDITCTVAPAVFFYQVYECDQDWTAYDSGESGDYTPTGTVDTSAAGANVLLAAGSTNTVTGSHVARIYKEGTTKKLHKYDGAFYSRMRQSTPSNPTLPKNTDGTKRPPVLCGPGAVAE